MKGFLNMKITGKLILAFVLVAILSGVVGVVGISNMRTIDENGYTIYSNITVPLSESAEIAKTFQRIRVNTRDMILESDPEKINEEYRKINTLIEDLNDLSILFEEKILSQDMDMAFNHFMDTRREFGAILPVFYELCIENNDEAAYELINGEMRIAADNEQDAIDTLVSMKVDDALNTANENRAVTEASIFIMTILVVGAVVLAIGLGVFISKIISKPLFKILDAANKIADGNLDVDINIEQKDEIGMLSKAFKIMINNINGVMTNINAASDQVATGSRQVSDSSMSLSQGATEQASSIQELTASIEEIASQTRQNATNAEKAEEKATSAQKYAEQGNLQMADMLEAMEGINESSNNISKIIKVIDDIAFQTNILALNAAVEAARAGQHGKGFAVVAEEVRNLAARSASAAKETTAMIEGSIHKVEGGTKIAHETADALNKIVEGISQATSLVGSIANASQEQAVGVDQINQGISQISDVVQTTSATAEETAAASEELSGQAEMLKAQVSQFKLRSLSKIDASDTVDPNVLKMLENMKNSENIKKDKNKSKKISLSDSDFEKY